MGCWYIRVFHTTLHTFHYSVYIYDENKDFKSNTAYEDEDIKISHLLRCIMWFASMFYAETRNKTMFLPLQTWIKILEINFSFVLDSTWLSYKIFKSFLFLHICNIWDEKKNNFTSLNLHTRTFIFKVPYIAAKYLSTLSFSSDCFI